MLEIVVFTHKLHIAHNATKAYLIEVQGLLHVGLRFELVVSVTKEERGMPQGRKLSIQMFCITLWLLLRAKGSR